MERALSAVFNDMGSLSRVLCATCRTTKGLERCARCELLVCRDCQPQHTCAGAPFSPASAVSPTTTGDRRHHCSTHRGGCRWAVVKRFTRGFLSGYGGRTLMYAVLGALRGRKQPPNLLDADNLRFGLFIGALCGTNSAVRCLLRGFRGFDCPAHAGIAGAVSGLALLLDKPSRHSSVALYLLCRAAYAGLQSMIQTGKLPKLPQLDVGLFAAANTAIMYAGVFEPQFLDPGYYRFMQKFGNLTHRGLEWTMRAPWRQAAANPSAPYVFRDCSVLYHPGKTCTQFTVNELLPLFIRACKIYAPVHLLPILVFRLSSLLRDPLSMATKVGGGVYHSAMFLTAYGTLMKALVCAFRKIRGRDATSHAVVGGGLTGLALLLEQPKRRSELALFCVPRALEIAYGMLVRARFVRSVRYGEVFTFAATMALLMTLNREAFKPTDRKVVRFLFGPA